MIQYLIDWLAFSSLWVAAVAGASCAAASLALGVTPAAPVVGIAMAGALLVYNVDRLRDLERDRRTAPERSAFVADHEAILRALTRGAAIAAAGFARWLGPSPALVLAPVLALGLFHRRLKRVPFFKPVYITLAWTAVVVALPAAHARVTSNAAWIAAVYGLAVFANAIAFNIRDREAVVARFGRRAALRSASALAVAAIVVDGALLVGAVVAIAWLSAA